MAGDGRDEVTQWGYLSTPEAMAVDALVQTVDLLQDILGDRYRVLLTTVHSNPAIKMAAMAREALSGLPLFGSSIRRLIAYEKASLAGVLVYQTGDRSTPTPA